MGDQRRRGRASPKATFLAAIFKDWDNAVYTAVAAFAEGTFPVGDVVLGLDGYNVGLDMSPTLPAGIGIEGREPVLRHSGALRTQTSIATRAEP